MNPGVLVLSIAAGILWSDMGNCLPVPLVASWLLGTGVLLCAFVSQIHEVGSRAAITRAVIAVATELGMQTLAEGVETEAERDFLLALGLRNMQGYLFGRPMDPEAFADAWTQVEPD